MNNTDSQPPASAVSVIVPIYKNLTVTRNCVESIAANGIPENVSVTLILDGSPEETLVTYCVEAAENYGLDIIINQENRGFVRTANEGMRLHPDADVILLNSDTVVSGNWIARLRDSAQRSDSIATVTPFSNNGTICSYPIFPCENALPPQWSPSQLDEVFQKANAAMQHPIPTAVGFCMYIKRRCLDEVGLFDEENFGLGYGEECDFCLRATQQGWTHMLAADVFVFHEGGASFSSESNQRKRDADEVMARLHPHYDALVTDFIHNDPLQSLRTRVDRQRILDQPAELEHVLAEQAAQSASIRKAIVQERENTQKVKAQVAELQSLLEQSRSEFQQADKSLRTTQDTLNEAHKALDELGKNFSSVQAEAKNLYDETQRLAGEIDDLGAKLYQSSDENKALKQRLEQIYASRSWRYTRWMRKEE